MGKTIARVAREAMYQCKGNKRNFFLAERVSVEKISKEEVNAGMKRLTAEAKKHKPKGCSNAEYVGFLPGLNNGSKQSTFQVGPFSNVFVREYHYRCNIAKNEKEYHIGYEKTLGMQWVEKETEEGMLVYLNDKALKFSSGEHCSIIGVTKYMSGVRPKYGPAVHCQQPPCGHESSY